MTHWNGDQGADRIASGPITPQTIEGTYGKLVLAADGSYTYTLNSSDPDFINLHGGASTVGPGRPFGAVPTGAMPERGDPERSVGPNAGTHGFGSFCQDKRDP
ncbi:VCBS domain-containing protein, partial [Pseudomonas auratipiscis]|uniref:VCBS domain-containing protein n=1 Tax=Pseudomonas auratipiscis TaxID=3115853 RepID=UPI0035CD2C04